VYEYMAKGSLENHLFRSEPRSKFVTGIFFLMPELTFIGRGGLCLSGYCSLVTEITGGQ
jgi:hypothetical protein